MNKKLIVIDSNKVDMLKLANIIGDSYDIVSKHDIEMMVEQRVDEIIRDRETEQESKRVAQIGELLSMIAHQWRQPLASISIATMAGRTKLELGIFDLDDSKGIDECKNKIIENYYKIDNFVQSLSQTIDNFRDFFKPNKESKMVNIDLSILRAIQITEDSLISDNIKIIKDLKCSKDIEVYDSELMQVFLNILKNSQDCFRDKKSIENPYIYIESIETKQGVDIIFTDNGGGIDSDIIEYIFDPYFSTKLESVGTGLGLSMSKTIIEKHHKGKIRVKNREDGVSFTIELKDTI
ncbi:histidine kinase [hydrothermal vent metagenome]|uniref:Histidine kinase n=1 Tax=hydrothermal vent metagenome TaxID=652676 RepID=A0A1W1BWR5_9ZZZZ